MGRAVSDEEIDRQLARLTPEEQAEFITDLRARKASRLGGNGWCRALSPEVAPILQEERCAAKYAAMSRFPGVANSISRRPSTARIRRLNVDRDR